MSNVTCTRTELRRASALEEAVLESPCHIEPTLRRPLRDDRVGCRWRTDESHLSATLLCHLEPQPFSALESACRTFVVSCLEPTLRRPLRDDPSFILHWLRIAVVVLRAFQPAFGSSCFINKVECATFTFHFVIPH